MDRKLLKAVVVVMRLGVDTDQSNAPTAVPDALKV